MKKMKTFAFAAAALLAGSAALTACSSDNEDTFGSQVVVTDDGTVGVKPEFVVSIPRSVVNTRMSGDVTQSAGTVAQFRGIDDILLIPFASEPADGVSKLDTVLSLSAISSLRQAGSLNYKVYANQFVPLGTKHFLFYGKAIGDATTQADKFKYGVLQTAGLDAAFTTPSAVDFTLETLYDKTDVLATDATGKAILDLLNKVAKTEGWAASDNEVLKDLYAKFTALKVRSSEMVAVVLSDLYFSAAHVDMDDAAAYAISLAIRANIEEAGTPKSKAPMALKAEYQGFPGNLGLPNGAAQIAWSAGEFKDVTATYSAAHEAKVTQYAYPAGLWYYVNTPIKASNEIESTEYDSKNNWNGVVDEVYSAATDVVNDKTQSVVLVKPAQYAVGRLELKITLGEEGKDKFYDQAGNEMDVTKGFTLKGVLIGGQNPVKYDFTANDGVATNLTIYDPTVAENTTAMPDPKATTAANQTLALETLKDQAVNIALELVNNGEAFTGKDGGIIPAGATFYLAAKLDPKAAANYKAGELDKIFMQDHVTKVTITIKNGKDDGGEDGPGGGGPTVPDLSSDTIELGTSVDLEWQEGLILTPSI